VTNIIYVNNKEKDKIAERTSRKAIKEIPMITKQTLKIVCMYMEQRHL